MFETVHVPILGIIENMSTFTCPHCGKGTDVFRSGALVPNVVSYANTSSIAGCDGDQPTSINAALRTRSSTHGRRLPRRGRTEDERGAEVPAFVRIDVALVAAHPPAGDQGSRNRRISRCPTGSGGPGIRGSGLLAARPAPCLALRDELGDVLVLAGVGVVEEPVIDLGRLE
jgi:hypothetical protein